MLWFHDERVFQREGAEMWRESRGTDASPRTSSGPLHKLRPIVSNVFLSLSLSLSLCVCVCVCVCVTATAGLLASLPALFC